MKKVFILFILSIALTGCNLFQTSAEDALSKASDKLDEVEAVEAFFTSEEVGNTSKSEGYFQYDYANDKYWYEVENPTQIGYKEGDFFQVLDESLFPIGDELDNDLSRVKIEGNIKQHRNILAFFKAHDEDFYKKFDIDELVKTATLTYNGDEAEQASMVESLINMQDKKIEEVYQGDENSGDITGKGFEASFTIDKDTLLINEATIQLNYVRNHKGEEDESDAEYYVSYESYNDINPMEEVDIDEVKQLKAQYNDSDSDIEESFSDVVDLNKENKALYEKEAKAYLDAFIQATIFQNPKKYAESIPGDASKKKKQKEGEAEADLFKDIYIENTEMNMEGFEVSDQTIEKLADAFLGALNKTKYEIDKAEANNDSEISVTLTVQGISDDEVYSSVEEKLREVAMSGEIEEKDLAEKNMDILAEEYRNIGNLTDEQTYEVTVYRNSDGTHTVIQDELLQGFVVFK